jgi:alpha-L-fucosidase
MKLHIRRNANLILCALVIVTLVAIMTLPAMAQTMSQDARMQWFREAKFGLFIHWGLYCIPAGEWKGQPVTGIGEWIMNRAKIPVKEYELLAQQFNPLKFNAEDIVKLAEDAGMKYIVITSKHHDGFAMYHSRVSNYNVVDATPFKRDVLKELADACAKHGMKLGFYYSQAQDWHEPNGAGNTWDFGIDSLKNFDQYLRDKAEPQVKEILTEYGPVCLVWFDTPRMMSKERSDRFINIVRSLQPGCLIDGRLGAQGDYRSMGDNRIPDTVVTGDWEVPATLNKTWGYKKDDNEWKSPEDLTFKLVDIVSKGGNYLLNVGPTSEGLVPQPSQDNLRAVGRWLKVNGESIYGAGPSPFGPEFGKPNPDTSKKDSRGNRLFDAKADWRCTTKPGKLFVHVFKWKSGAFELPAVQGTIGKAYLLSDASRKPLLVQQGASNATVTLPEKAPDAMDSVLVLEISSH